VAKWPFQAEEGSLGTWDSFPIWITERSEQTALSVNILARTLHMTPEPLTADRLYLFENLQSIPTLLFSYTTFWAWFLSQHDLTHPRIHPKTLIWPSGC
jgi:hypothetical protein